MLKQLGRNTVIYALGNIGMRAGVLLLIPLFTHALSVADYGLLAALQLTVQIVMIVMNGGMRICLLRFTGEFKNGNRLGHFVGTTCAVNLLGGAVVTALVFLFLTTFFRHTLHLDNPYPYLGMVCGLALIQSLTVHLTAYFRIEDRAGTFMMVGIVTILLLLITTAVFLYRFHLGVMGALSASAVAYACVLAGVSWSVLSKTGMGISLSLVPRLLRFGFPLIFSELALLILGGASVYVLGYVSSLEVVAIYSLGYKLAGVVIIAVIAPFQLAFQPFVYTNFEQEGFNEKLSGVITYLVLGVTVGIFFILLGSRLLLPLIAPPAYSSAFLVLLLLLPGTSFISIYYVGETLLAAVNRTHLTGLVMSVYALLAILLNCLLIPRMNWTGAVIASNTCYLLAGVTFMIIAKRYVHFPLEWRRVGVCLLIIAFFCSSFLALRDTALTFFIGCSTAAALVSLAVLLKVRFFKHAELAFIKRALIPLE